MAKNKLAKFAELDQLSNTFQYPFSVMRENGHNFPYRGVWRREVFGNDRPIVLELGCGRGEYTVGLGESYPQQNFIGIDIKGNRMCAGAKEATQKGMPNVRFLRTQIELLPFFFATGEVDEIWLTFPDPQMKKVGKRLTSTRFLNMYQRVLAPNGLLHLKSDSQFLYQYTYEVAMLNALPILENYTDIYTQLKEDALLRKIQTHYEKQWISRGITIKYLQVMLGSTDIATLTEPDVEIEWDSYRSYGRGKLSEIDKMRQSFQK